MSRISLNPQARPVDTFAPASVAPSSARSTAQLAESLQSFTGTLIDFADKKSERDKEEAEGEARKQLAELQIVNREQFRKAQADGLINEDDNPHKLTFMLALIGQAEIRDTVTAFESEYEKSALRNSDNPTEIRAALRERVAGLFDDRGSMESTVMSREFEQIEQRFVERHLQRRREARNADTQMAFGRSITESLRNDDLEGVADVVTAAYESGMNPEQVRSTATSMIYAQALEDGDEASLIRNLESIKVGGKSLTETLPPNEIKKMRDDIESSALAEVELGERRMRLQRSQTARLISEQVASGSRSYEDVLADPSVPDYAKTSIIETRNAVRAAQASAAGAEALSDGHFSEEEMTTLAIQFADQVGVIERMAATSRRIKDSMIETPFETTHRLNEAMMDPDVTYEDMHGMIDTLRASGKISEEDAVAQLRSAAQHKNNRGFQTFSQEASNALQLVDLSVTQTLLDQFGDEDPITGQRRLSPEGEQQALQVINEVRGRFRDMYAENPDQSGLFYRMQMNALTETVLKDYGLKPIAEAEKSRAVGQARSTMIPTGVGLVADDVSNLRFTDGKITAYLGLDEVDVGEPIYIVSEEDAFFEGDPNRPVFRTKKFLTDARTMGVRNGEELEALIRSHEALLGPAWVEAVLNNELIKSLISGAVQTEREAAEQAARIEQSRNFATAFAGTGAGQNPSRLPQEDN
jgi:hypothetical protein